MTVETTSQQAPSEEVVATPPAVGEQGTAQPQQEQQQPQPESGAHSEDDDPPKYYTRKQIEEIARKRIDKLRLQAGEAERRAEAERAERLRVEQQARQLWQQQQELTHRATQPTLSQFGSVEEYERAVAAHYAQYAQQQVGVMQQDIDRRAQMQAHEQFQRTLSTRIAEATQKFPDYEDVVNNPALPPMQSVNPVTLNAILRHPMMPEITYYLGKNPAEAHKVAGMTPDQALIEVGNIAAKLAASPPRQTPNAPAPPPEVGGTKAASVRSLSELAESDYNAYVRARRKQRGLAK